MKLNYTINLYMDEITHINIDKYSKSFNEKSKNILAKNAVTNSPISGIMINNSNLKNQIEVFSNVIDTKASITDQENSGRCWIFSLLNIIRLKMIETYKLADDFELSQNYLYFWHIFESANNFLHTIIKTKNEDSESRLIYALLENPISDGGHWEMLINIVEKYGMIPKYQMKETVHSAETQEINDYINNTLRCYAYTLRTDKKSNNKETIDNMMNNIYKMLVIFLGEPPKTIEWKYYKNNDDKQKYKYMNNITPIEFYNKYIPYNLKDKICLINYPCSSKPYYNTYDVEYSSNMVGQNKTNYVNVPIKIMKDCIIKSIDNKEAVWFGSDVGKNADPHLGVLDNKTINYKNIFDMDMQMNKCTKLDYRNGEISHAMIIKGYDKPKDKNTVLKELEIINKKGSKKHSVKHRNKQNNKKIKSHKNLKNKRGGNNDKDVNNPLKYLVENSWGEKIGEKNTGNFIMSDEWFDENVYLIVVDKKCLSPEIKKKINNGKHIMLPYWSPFGKLMF